MYNLILPIVLLCFGIYLNNSGNKIHNIKNLSFAFACMTGVVIILSTDIMRMVNTTLLFLFFVMTAEILWYKKNPDYTTSKKYVLYDMDHMIIKNALLNYHLENDLPYTTDYIEEKRIELIETDNYNIVIQDKRFPSVALKVESRKGVEDMEETLNSLDEAIFRLQSTHEHMSHSEAGRFVIYIAVIYGLCILTLNIIFSAVAGMI